LLKLLHLSLGLEEHSRLAGIDVAAHNEGQMGLAFPVSVNTTHGWLPWSREVVRVAALVEAAASTKRLRAVMRTALVALRERAGYHAIPFPL
jgi:hypothetical protein